MCPRPFGLLEGREEGDLVVVIVVVIIIDIG
jgi:hypothetical protein